MFEHLRKFLCKFQQLFFQSGERTNSTGLRKNVQVDSRSSVRAP